MKGSSDVDVLILGAGAAGLMAAKRLSDAGFSVCVVEARDRTGGRIWTIHDPASHIPVEMGAEFIHGRSPEIFDLVSFAKLAHYEVEGDFWCSIDGRLFVCDEVENEIDELLKGADPNQPDCSVAELVFRNRHRLGSTACKEVLAYIEGFEAARPEQMSVHALMRERRAATVAHSEHAYRLTSGYDSLMQSIEQDLMAVIELNSPVKAVRWAPGWVEFVSQEKTFRANRAVITLPLAMLQGRRVQFKPAIDCKTRALSMLATGPVIRIVVRFQQRFWERLEAELAGGRRSMRDLSFLFSDSQTFPTWWTTMPVQSAVLVGWSAGPHAESLCFREKEFVFEEAMRSLSRLFRRDSTELTRLVESYRIHDWQADPYSLGAYSYALVGGDDAFRELGEPIADTLYFAGEATNSDGHNGTVHGALQTGERVAREILSSAENSRVQRRRA